MATLTMLVGVSNGSKTDYMTTHAHDALIINPDALRQQLFGTLQVKKSQKSIIFNQITKVLNQAIKTQRDIWYNVIDNSRKQRILLYNQAKKHHYHVRLIWFIADMRTLVANNPLQLPTSFLKRQLLALDPPIKHLDCDELIVKITGNLKRYANITSPLRFACDFIACSDAVGQQLYQTTQIPDNGIYHTESLQTHLQLCVQTAQAQHDELLVTLAKWHDVGKVAVRQYDETKHTYHYYDHEIYSSYAYAVHTLLTQHTISPQQAVIMQLIRWHMAPFRGVSQRLLMREQLSADELALLRTFNQIDKASSLGK